MWSCRNGLVRESDPCGTFSSRISTVGLISVNLKEHKQSIQRLWYDIVESYSRRSLKFPSDVLPAIAAFSSKFQDTQPEKRYLVGLWEDTLRFDLFWYVPWIYKANSPHEDELVASRGMPSWPWSSLTVPVEWSQSLGPEYYQCIPCSRMSRLHVIRQNHQYLEIFRKLILSSKPLSSILARFFHGNGHRAQRNQTPNSRGKQSKLLIASN
jgi:hypothetical protein